MAILADILKGAIWFILVLVIFAVVLSLIRGEMVRGINEILTHHYKLRTEYLKEFEKTAANQPPRRTGSSYN